MAEWQNGRMAECENGIRKPKYKKMTKSLKLIVEQPGLRI
jgi:hypothetical protein